MIEELKSDEIIKKVGGKYKLTADESLKLRHKIGSRNNGIFALMRMGAMAALAF